MVQEVEEIVLSPQLVQATDQDISIINENEGDEILDEDEDDYIVEKDEYHLKYLERLKLHDSTLIELELRGLREPVYDMDELLNAIAEILELAEQNPQIVKLEFGFIPVNHPVIMQAATNLLTCDERIWRKIEVVHCDDFDPQFLADVICKPSHPCRVQSLRFINSRLLPEALQYISRIMTSSKDLDNLSISDDLDSTDLSILSNGLCTNTTLSSLDFEGSHFHFEDEVFESCSPLVMGLKGVSNLSFLSLGCCKLLDHQIAIILRALDNHSSLRGLDLSFNNCGPKTCHALVGLIQKQLIGLTMTYCEIQDTDLSILLEGFSTPETSLENLYLCGNYITDSGVLEFVYYLGLNASLRRLGFYNNKFGALGACAFRHALQKNHQVKQLLMDNRPYYEEIQFFCALNDCGRRLLQSDQVPLGLWPLVLHRAQRRNFYCREHGSTDVLYFLLQGLFSCQG